jgi:hypothetical protein
MAQQKRRTAPKKRRAAPEALRQQGRKAGRREGGKAGRQEGAKAGRQESGKAGRSSAQRGRTAAQKVRSARRRGPTASPKARKAAEQRAFELFDRQIEPLWGRLENECRQFAQGFNQEMGADQLRVESNPAGVMVRLMTDGAEVFFQLDRTARHVSVAMTTGCTNFGSCITDQAPVGLAILEGELRFLFGGSTISEEELAVKILTDLLEADSPKASR